MLNFGNAFIFQPGPGAWDHTVDEREHTVEQWKDLIYHEVIDYERTHNTLGPGGSGSATGAVTGSASAVTAGSRSAANAKIDGEDEVMQHTASARR